MRDFNGSVSAATLRDHNSSTFSTNMHALLIKRWHNSKRDKKGLCCQVGIRSGAFIYRRIYVFINVCFLLQVLLPVLVVLGGVGVLEVGYANIVLLHVPSLLTLFHFCVLL